MYCPKVDIHVNQIHQSTTFTYSVLTKIVRPCLVESIDHAFHLVNVGQELNHR